MQFEQPRFDVDDDLYSQLFLHGARKLDWRGVPIRVPDKVVAIIRHGVLTPSGTQVEAIDGEPFLSTRAEEVDDGGLSFRIGSEGEGG